MDVSPNGQTLVFSADGGLYLLEFKSNRVKRLVPKTAKCEAPAFSPDGAKIVYSAQTPGKHSSDLCELTLKTSATRRLTRGGAFSDSDPSYSPDGTRIVFVRSFRYRQYSMGGMVWSDHDICVMQADGTGLKQLTHEDYYAANGPKFTRDGTAIIFSGDPPGVGEDAPIHALLRVSASKGGRPVALLPPTKKQSGSDGSDPDVSPDGKRIAFIADRVTPFKYDIFTAKIDGTDLHALKITSISSYNQKPVFMPDGKRLLFLAGTETDARSRSVFSLWRVNIDGTGARKVADEGLFLNPATWKPRAPLPADASSTKRALAGGTNPNQRDAVGRTLLSNAAKRGDVDAVRLLLQKGANPNLADKDGTTPLVQAIAKNSLEIVKLLLAKGAKVTAPSEGKGVNGMPPLILAAMLRSIPIVEALLQAGADINASDASMGNTALHFACIEKGGLPMVRLLLAKGISVDARSSLGGTPLMSAAMAGDLEVVKLLVEKGANVNARDDRTRQEYGRALFTGDKAGAERIRKSGKLDTLHEDGRSVMDWAQIGGNQQVVAYLQKLVKKN